MMKARFFPIMAFLALTIQMANAADYFPIPFKEDPPIMVDGSLDDWKVVPHKFTLDNEKCLLTLEQDKSKWQGKSDFSGTVQVAYRDYALMLAIEVEDDLLVQNYSGKNLWMGDHVEVFIDTIPQIKSPGDNFVKGQFHLGISPGDFANRKPEIQCFTPGNLQLQGTKLEAAKSSKGWLLEAEIPWSNFNFIPSQDKVIGLEIWLSDTDDKTGTGIALQKSVLTFGSNSRKSNSRTNLRRAVFTTADGKIGNVQADAFKTISISRHSCLKPSASLALTTICGNIQDGVSPVLTFNAKLNDELPVIFFLSHALSINVNGVELGPRQLLERSLVMRKKDNSDLKIWANEGFLLPCTARFESAGKWFETREFIKRHEDLSYFSFDLSSIVNEGENKITFRNADGNRSVDIKDLRLDFKAGSLKRPKRPAPTGQLPVCMPCKSFGTDAIICGNANIPGTPTAEIELRNGKKHWKVLSRYSTPDGNWVNNSCKWFKLKRKVTNCAAGLIVTDTFTNLTNEILPLMQEHKVQVNEMDKALVGGLERTTQDGFRSSGNCTVFASDKQHNGIGLMPLSRAFSIHAEMAALTNGIALADHQFALPPQGIFTQEFLIVPSSRGDYWDFISAIRTYLDINATLDGAYGMFNVAWGPWPDERIVKRFRDGNVKTIGMDTYGVNDPQKIKTTIARIRKLLPDVKILRYYHAQLGTFPEDNVPSDEDAVLLRSGKIATYYNFSWKIYLTTLDNKYGKIKEMQLDDLLANWDIDGIFWDEFCSSGTSYHYGEPWDGCSADIDEASHKLLKRKSSVYLLQFDWKMKQVDRLLAAHKYIFSGVNRDFLKKVPHGHCETAQLSNCAAQILRSPMQMGDYTNHKATWIDYYEAMRDGLDYGLLFNWGHLSLPAPNKETYPTLIQHMYPLTPLEFRKGCVWGKERLVTKNSGKYGWDDASAHQVHVYDDEGREAPGQASATFTENGKNWTELRLPEGWSAVIVRIPQKSSE